MPSASARQVGSLHRACVAGLLICTPVWLVVAYGDQPAGKQKPKLTFKALVAKVPAKERAKFFDSLSFTKKGISGAYIKDVRAKLSAAEFKAMLAPVGFGENDFMDFRCGATNDCFASSGYICNTVSCGSRGGSLTLGEAFAKMDAKKKAKFVNSLDFANGRLVSAYTTDVKAHLAPKDFEKLFTFMGVSANDLKAKTKAGVFKASPAK
jgi:hypothetical protein